MEIDDTNYFIVVKAIKFVYNEGYNVSDMDYKYECNAAERTVEKRSDRSYFVDVFKVDDKFIVEIPNDTDGIVETDTDSDTVTINKAEYDRLINREFELICLESAGVDNWEGYDEAFDGYDEALEEYRREIE